MTIKASSIKEAVERLNIEKSDKSIVINVLKKKTGEIQESYSSKMKKAEEALSKAQLNYEKSKISAEEDSIKEVLVEAMKFLGIKEKKENNQESH